MTNNKLYNGYIGIDFATPEAPDVELITLFARYIMTGEFHVVGIPEELINKLDLIPGVSLDVRGIDGKKKSEYRSQETE